MMQHENAMPWQHVSPIHSSPKRKAFAQYRCRTYSWWQLALNPVVGSNEMTYKSMVSVRVEKHNIYDIHHHLSPKWCHRV
jgi:hypothetical protein